MPRDRFRTYAEFWAYYLTQHRNRTNRRLHLVGAFLGVVIILKYRSWAALGAAIGVGYAVAWVGHLFFEKNRPATWAYPLWSFISEFRMVGQMLRRRI